MDTKPTIAVLGASGLIGFQVAKGLKAEGYSVASIARRFTSPQRAVLAENCVEVPITTLESAALAELLKDASIVVNCIGALQDGPNGRVSDAHDGFVGKLLQVLGGGEDKRLLIHVSIPGSAEEDQTSFSQTKRAADRAITDSTVPHVIIRPGFVVAPTAFGGSALMRSLATLPVTLSKAESDRTFASTDIADIVSTVAHLAKDWPIGGKPMSHVWDVMEKDQGTVGDVVAAFRNVLGGPRAILPLPAWCLSLGARAGDVVSHLGWSPPIRTTALSEMRRGVAGDPQAWMSATGITPYSAAAAINRHSGTVQDRWFSRLYLFKAAALVTLAAFWCVSGLIALFPSFDAAASILSSRGFPHDLAIAITLVTGLADVLIGVGIAIKRTCKAALIAGIVVALLYLASSVIITPELWLDPIGSLVKTVPATVLMVFSLLTLDNR